MNLKGMCRSKSLSRRRCKWE